MPQTPGKSLPSSPVIQFYPPAAAYRVHVC
jgi:hypothetical protein